jgi:hypothetical protein
MPYAARCMFARLPAQADLERLLSLFASLCADEIWGVRKVGLSVCPPVFTAQPPALSLPLHVARRAHRAVRARWAGARARLPARASRRVVCVARAGFVCARCLWFTGRAEAFADTILRTLCSSHCVPLC